MELPYIIKEKKINGKIKQKPEHFVVEEIPLYPPSGEGEHLYISLTKTNLTSTEVQKQLSGVFGVNIKEIGFAGMKDKNAVTTQTFSIFIGKINKEEFEKIKEKIEDNIPIKVNWLNLHENKIKKGHLLGNRFTITITSLKDPKKDFLQTEKIISEIKQKGLPNYFGPQRFGIFSDNMFKGLEIIKGKAKPKDRWLKKFLISSYQSYLCNKYLAKRVLSGYFEKIMKGDIAKKYSNGALFEVEDPEIEQERFNNKEISFTCPIYGLKMWEAKHESGEFEKKVLSESEVSMDDFKRLNIKGTRRLGRLLISDIKAELKENNLILTFSLPKGAFATTVLREIIKQKSLNIS